jgi:hypothetical protein
MGSSVRADGGTQSALKPVWSPQPGPQTALVNCPLAEIFYGGARGAGKTDGVVGKWALKEARYGTAFNALAVRRTKISFEDAIARSKEIYEPLGGKFTGDTWRMPNGGRVSFKYLESVDDAQEYQGRNVTDAWVEEVGQYPRPDPILRLFGVLRSAAGVPVQMIVTGNPGGAGQHWVRGRYDLHPFPEHPRVLIRELANGSFHRVAVIPGRLRDNRILMREDPEYVNRLHLVGSAQLVKAWLDGDWTAIEGAFFDCWSERNVVPPFTIPREWVRFRSGDWGSASPFSFGWWAVVQDDYAIPGDSRVQYHLGQLVGADPGLSRSGVGSEMDRGRSAVGIHRAGGLRGAAVLPRGALVRYREWYGSTDPASGGKGLKLTAEEVGAGLVEREAGEKIAYGVLDPATFKVDGGPSIGERINRALVKAKLASFRAADNTRVNTRDSKDRRGPMNGWDQMRARIIGILDDKGRPTGVPMVYTFSTCTASIRTIPVLQHDPAKPEDLDTESEDHAADDWRYACSSRPWMRTIKEPDVPKDAYQVAAEDMADVQSSVKLS